MSDKTTDSKRRGTVSQSQLDILTLLAQYRFLTPELTARLLKQKHLSVIRSRLAILMGNGLIGRHYAPSFKLLGKPASYCMLPAGIRILKDRTDLHPQAAKLLYRDRQASEDFIETCQVICSLCLSLQERFADQVTAFTKTELYEYDYFPRPLPDLYLLDDPISNRHWFIQLHGPAVPAFATLQKVRRHVAYVQSGAWDETGTPCPGLVILCHNTASEALLRRRLRMVLSGTTSQ